MLSADTGLTDQQIQYYVGATCDTPTGALTSIGIGSDNHFIDTIVSPVNGTIYTYTVTSVDAAGNTSTSACSSSLTYDTAPPLAVTTPSLGWMQISPFNATSVDSTSVSYTHLTLPTICSV